MTERRRGVFVKVHSHGIDILLSQTAQWGVGGGEAVEVLTAKACIVTECTSPAKSCVVNGAVAVGIHH